MILELSLWVKLILAVAVAFLISFAMTPIVKSFAVKVGAIDVPTEKRRVHDHPIPRMGGLAIFIGFLLSDKNTGQGRPGFRPAAAADQK